MSQVPASQRVRVRLDTTPEQHARLLSLQRAFAEVCNALTPTVSSTRCWNRVALHHMTYRSLREQFPALGSQMVCNAILAVCRAARLVYQHPRSPFNVARLGERPLPRLRFADTCPVYFDRHTMSLRDGLLSLYTLDGRARFRIRLDAGHELAFRNQRLREVVLSRGAGGAFELSFSFSAAQAEPERPAGPAAWPEYLLVEEEAA